MDDLRTLIDAYNDAWNRQDLDAVAAMHHDEIVFHNSTAGERVEGAAAVREHIGRIFANWPTLTFTSRTLRVGDDFVVSEWTAHALRDGETIEWDGVDIFPVVNGKIARKDVYSSSHAPRRS
jgi:ketosteroid isomerase-like protein